MKEYLELVQDSFTLEHFDKQAIDKWPYVAYSIKDDEVIYTIIPKEDGYTLIALKKVDISGITYEEVDLGLSVKWANKNIGALTEEDYGAYFSWGNTDGYAVSGTKFLTLEETYKLVYDTLGKSVSTKEELETVLADNSLTIDNFGTVDGYSFDVDTYKGTSGAAVTTLDTEHDAAVVNMKGDWRMPTIAEQKELVNAVKTSADDTTNPLTCTYVYLDKERNVQELTVYREDTINVSLPEYSWISGVRFTNASTGASVFFPTCGCVIDSSLGNIGINGLYWSSSILTYYKSNALIFYFTPTYVSAAYNSQRRFGVCVRAVK